MKKIIVGTANFGNLYGAFNQKKITNDDIKSIINFAQNHNLNHFDTAKSYRDSEEVLGRYLNKSNAVKVDTKLSVFDCQSVEQMVSSVKKSIDLLRIPKVSTIYIHGASLVLGEKRNKVLQGLREIMAQGLAEYLGVSIYTLDELLQCKTIFSDFTRFQILENICDRRLSDSKELIELAREKNVINVRSIFLQGLLLSNPQTLSGKFANAKKTISELNNFAQENGISVFQICVAYIESIEWVSKIVVGVDSKKQLEQIINSSFRLPPGWHNYIPKLPVGLLDPRLW